MSTMSASIGSSTPAFDLVTLGEAMIEFNQTRAGERQFLQGFGGDTSNAAIAAARAGATCAYLTRLGTDPFGDELMALWHAEGVDTSGIQRDARHPTGVYFVTHGESGHQFSYLRSNSAASRMAPQWLEQAPTRGILQSTRMLLVSGISLAISASACDTVFAAMTVARAAGAQVALDSNLRLKLWPLERARACITHAVSLCDIFLPSLDDMTVLTGLQEPDEIIDWSHRHGASTVVLKLGDKGALVSVNGARTAAPVFKANAVDATGAGDCFCGNLLARIAAGDDVAAAARYANAAASIAVEGFGAVAPLPRPEQVTLRMG